MRQSAHSRRRENLRGAPVQHSCVGPFSGPPRLRAAARRPTRTRFLNSKILRFYEIARCGFLTPRFLNGRKSTMFCSRCGCCERQCRRVLLLFNNSGPPHFGYSLLDEASIPPAVRRLSYLARTNAFHEKSHSRPSKRNPSLRGTGTWSSPSQVPRRRRRRRRKPPRRRICRR